MDTIIKNKQYYKFCLYGFLKNLRFFDAFFILFLVENGLSYTQIGILYASREICINLFEIPSGIIADTFGRKNSLIASFFIYIISFLVFNFSNNFWLFLIAFIMYGIADAFRSGTHKGMIMEYLKINNWQNKKINYYGHTRSWSQKGSAVSSLIAGLLIFYSGNYQNIFLFSIIPYLINLLLIISYPNYLNSTLNKTNSTNKFKFKTSTKSLFETLKQPNVVNIISTSALFSAYLKAVKDYIQPLMINVALLIPIFINIEVGKKNAIIVGVLYFLIYLLTSKASLLSSKTAMKSKKNIPHITLILGFISGVSCGVFYYYNLWIIAILAFVAIFIIENLRKPILTGYIADNVPQEILTSVLSVQAQLNTFITAILAFAFGVIADIYGIGISFIVISLFLVALTIFINRFNVLRKNKLIDS